MSVFVKVHGLQRTGSNYLVWLLEHNTRDVVVLVNELGWKHGPVLDKLVRWGRDELRQHWDEYREELVTEDLKKAHREGVLRYVFTVRNPFSWWVGFAKWTGRKPSPVDEQYFAEKWNDVQRGYVEFFHAQRHRCVLVRHEELVEGAEWSLTRVCRHLALTRKNETVNSDARFGRYNEHGLTQEQRFTDNDYYLCHEYMRELSEHDVELIQKTADPTVTEFLGYRLDPPTTMKTEND